MLACAAVNCQCIRGQGDSAFYLLTRMLRYSAASIYSQAVKAGSARALPLAHVRQPSMLYVQHLWPAMQAVQRVISDGGGTSGVQESVGALCTAMWERFFFRQALSSR
jgi:hypothetical protein